MESDFTALETAIGYSFKEKSLLQLALTHSSCEREYGDNQRLEFLGDAVLGLVVASTLHKAYPDADEGALDQMRASIVNGRSLAARARALGIGSALLVSDAHAQHRPEPSAGMLEDAIEALFGAIFEDGGYEAAAKTIQHILREELSMVADISFNSNPKGALQEWSQAQHEGAVPKYEVLSESGPDHAKLYTVAVEIAGQEFARAEASSVKGAEAAAARLALQQTKG